ncbi:MAG TPA: two-component regulator propeller domain-containing protein [Planctomycetota bacterium]|jgi:ligand-binding sensor domain-containing protein/signal transduction histidine kinase|nr:two-component regulator propeller domain-containing protein [Planctomycetota bacterium]
MLAMPTHPGFARRFAALVLLCALAPGVFAQTLPFRRYDVPEGLPNSRVNFVFQDSRGYLWFGTWEGLSRFDGVEFKNYGTREGLPNFLVNAIAEDPTGHIWVATQGGGVARLVDRRESPILFEPHTVGATRESNIVAGLFFDREGALWCGSERGIFRAKDPRAADLSFERIVEDGVVDSSQFGCVDASGHVWVCTPTAIVEIEGTRVVARHTAPDPALAAEHVYAILPRAGGGVLVGFRKDVFEFTPPGWHRLPIEFAPEQEVRCALLASKETLWLGTTGGLVRWRAGAQTSYASESGLPDISIRYLREDRDGVLWMGTWSSGVVKLASEAIVNFVLPSAMPDRNALRVLEARDGSIYAPGKTGILRVRGERAELVPGSDDPRFAAIANRMLQDSRGDFWIGTSGGLYRFDGPGLDLARGRHFVDGDGIPEQGVFGRIHEDREGRIWVSVLDGALYDWDPSKSATPHFDRVPFQDDVGLQLPRDFLSDAEGQLWLAPYVGLARRVDGKLQPLEASEGLPDLQTRCLLEDHLGRVWIGTRFHGVSVTDEPAAARPKFRNYSTHEGLASDAVWSIAEDGEGRMYLATSRGMERLDVASGRVKHVTTSDGLAGDIVNQVIQDHAGRIWAATSGGLSRYDPRAEAPAPEPPPVYLARVRVAGEELPISETGEISIPEVSLPASKDNLRIDFVGLSFRGERDLVYQYELEGIDKDWSQPSPERSVNYAHLAAGSYVFLVRALHPDGARSGTPASFAFRIQPPVWRQSWFIALAAVLVGAMAFAIHRARVRRFLALEEIRTQIATDIHDDIGSGLSQIAILSEVAKRESTPAVQRHLDEVAGLARTMRESMSDIVWAVDPRRDRFGDLVQRMRQAAFNLLEAEGLRVEFRAPADAALDGIGLAPDRRRHLLLILKESLSNVARHARASHVVVDIRIDAGKLLLSIKDDGCGFDAASESRGHGLASLRQRTTRIDGTIRIDSSPGDGASIEVAVPL